MRVSQTLGCMAHYGVDQLQNFECAMRLGMMWYNVEQLKRQFCILLSELIDARWSALPKADW